MNFFSRIFGFTPKVPVRPKNVVTFDDVGVSRHLQDGRIESVTWDELQEVEILTTDEGPFVDDVFWILSGKDRGCAVPSEAEGMSELVLRLQALPGFNNEVMIQAMGSSENAKFKCWTRPNVP